MRKATGSSIRVFNGGSGEWKATVIGTSDGRVVLRAEECLQSPEAKVISEKQVTLCFPPLKKIPQNFLVQKATELGIFGLQPILTEYTTTDAKGSQKLLNIAIEAAEQSERTQVPTVFPAISLQNFFVKTPHTTPIVLTERYESWMQGTNELGKPRYYENMIDGIIQSGIYLDSHFAVFIGPEGGWSPKELQFLANNSACHFFSLGINKILRSETAALLGVGLLMSTLDSKALHNTTRPSIPLSHTINFKDDSD